MAQHIIIRPTEGDHAKVNFAAVQQSNAMSESICSGQTSGEAEGHA